MTETDHDTTVPQLLTRLVVETEKMIRLANDITKHGSTPQAQSAMALLSAEVSGFLTVIKDSIEPLYNLYDIDPGMKTAAHGLEAETKKNEYDESALWGDIAKS